jgi:hypothetical protein
MGYTSRVGIDVFGTSFLIFSRCMIETEAVRPSKEHCPGTPSPTVLCVCVSQSPADITRAHCERVLTPSDWLGGLTGRTKETPEGALNESATDLAKAAASEVG